MSLVSLGSTSTFWTPISPLFGDSQTRSEAWRRNLDLVGGAGKGFSANDRITQTLPTAQRRCGSGCSSREPARLRRLPKEHGHAILPLRMDPDPTQWYKPEISYIKGSLVVSISAYKGTHKHDTYSVLPQYCVSTFSGLSTLATVLFV